MLVSFPRRRESKILVTCHLSPERHQPRERFRHSAEEIMDKMDGIDKMDKTKSIMSMSSIMSIKAILQLEDVSYSVYLLIEFMEFLAELIGGCGGDFELVGLTFERGRRRNATRPGQPGLCDN